MIDLKPHEDKIKSLFCSGLEVADIAQKMNRSKKYISRVMSTVRKKTRQNNQQLIMNYLTQQGDYNA